MARPRRIHGKIARSKVKPINATTSVIADRLTMALLLSVMNCQRGIKAIATAVENDVLGDVGRERDGRSALVFEH